MITQSELNKFDTLASAWQYYEQKLNWQVFSCQIELSNGKKNTVFMPQWKTHQFDITDLKSRHNVLAVKTGDISGITVIDLDIRDEEQRNELLASCNLKLESFPYALTPGGGVHIYFKSSEQLRVLFGRKNLTTANKELKIDVRDNNSLIFLPPSYIDGYGSYRWVNLPASSEAIPSYDDSIINLLQLLYPDHNTKVKDQKLPFKEILPRPAYSPARLYPEIDENDFILADEMIDDLCDKDISYEEWRNIGYALFAKFGEYGKPLFDRLLYNPHFNDTQQQIDSMWNSFRSVHSIGFGTLVHIWRKYVD